MYTATDSRTRPAADSSSPWSRLRSGAILQAVVTAGLLLCSCGRNRVWNPEAEWLQAARMQEAADYGGAMRIAEAGIAAAGKDSASEWYWRFRILKAETLFAQGSSNEATVLLQIPVGPVPHAAELEAQRLLDLGMMAYHRTDYPHASEFFERAQTLAAPFPDSPVSRRLDLGLGLVLQERGEFTQAEALYRKALGKAEQLGDSHTTEAALGNLGYMRMKAARYDEALAFFDQLLKLLRPSTLHRAATLTNMGWCYYDLGDLDRARNSFEESDELMQRLHSRYRSTALGGFGRIYHARGMFPEAIVWFRKAADSAHDYQMPDLNAEWLTYLAASSIEMRDLAGAETANRDAGKLYADLPNKPMRAWQMLNAARLAEERHSLDEAERGYRSVAETQQFLAARVAAGDRLALLLGRLNRPDEANVEFKRAAGLVEDKRAGMLKDDYKITFLASVARLYSDYVEFLSSRNQVGEALRLAESSRARLLAEKLGREDPVTSTKNPRIYQTLAAASRTVFLCYWTAPKTSYLWVVTATGTEQFRLPPESKLKALVDSYNKAIRERDLVVTGHPAARELYEALIQPAQRFIPPGSTVAIVPDGPLHHLNFEALLVPAPHPHYWIEDVTISLVPSLNVLETGTASRPGASLLLIGDPVSAGQQFPRLAHAATEILSVESNFPAARTVALTGLAARPDAYAQAHPKRFSTIHFTSHAVANYESPLDSAVILSPGGESFKLYAREVMSQPIQADLVTLSACESAGTRDYSGEGLVGFAWAFLQAGAHNVVAGLWNVDDASTAQIMDFMYAQIRKGRTPAEALRDAKLSLIRSKGNYRKPNYWATFELFTRSLPKARSSRSQAALPLRTARIPPPPSP